MEEIKTAQATLKYARISSRKVKIVADLIRGKIYTKSFFRNNRKAFKISYCKR